jgi:hypothetical protein
MATTYIHRIYQLALISNDTAHIVKVFQVLQGFYFINFVLNVCLQNNTWSSLYKNSKPTYIRNLDQTNPLLLIRKIKLKTLQNNEKINSKTTRKINIIYNRIMANWSLWDHG